MSGVSELLRYFSQYGEDFLLSEFFDRKPGGYYVDVGAFDGVHLSNSYSFELLGWRGACVEANPEMHARCSALRPQAHCINAACVRPGQQGDIDLHVDQTGLFSSIDAAEVEHGNLKLHLEAIGQAPQELRVVNVPAITIERALEQADAPVEIDFVSIDTEGNEADILSGFDFAKRNVRVFVIEENNATAHDDISRALSGHGYHFARKVGPNAFYARSDADCEKLQQIEITCTIEKQLHPLGAQHTPQNYLDGLKLYRGQNALRLCREKEHVDAEAARLREASSREKERRQDLEDRLDECTAKRKQLNGNLEHLHRRVESLEARNRELDDALAKLTSDDKLK